MKKTFTFSGLMILCLFFFINASFAQTVVVKGKATDAVTSESLPGVSIVIKGTTTGTQTDVNGAFSINAPSNATLVFTYIGYSPKEVAVNNQTTINVALQPESKELQQVVV